MNPWSRLKYAGSKSFIPEDDRLPYPVYEVLTQDDTYKTLADLRYLASEVSDESPTEAYNHTLAAWDSASSAVDAYVAEWIRAKQEWLTDDFGLDDRDVAEACAEYDIRS